MRVYLTQSGWPELAYEGYGALFIHSFACTVKVMILGVFMIVWPS